MKYRVKIDLSFEVETDARSLMASSKAMVGRAVSVQMGREDTHISFCELELCRHDEGLPCTIAERVEVKA